MSREELDLKVSSHNRYMWETQDRQSLVVNLEVY